MFQQLKVERRTCFLFFSLSLWLWSCSSLWEKTVTQRRHRSGWEEVDPPPMPLPPSTPPPPLPPSACDHSDPAAQVLDLLWSHSQVSGQNSELPPVWSLCWCNRLTVSNRLIVSRLRQSPRSLSSVLLLVRSIGWSIDINYYMACVLQ